MLNRCLCASFPLPEESGRAGTLLPRSSTPPSKFIPPLNCCSLLILFQRTQNKKEEKKNPPLFSLHLIHFLPFSQNPPLVLEEVALSDRAKIEDKKRPGEVDPLRIALSVLCFVHSLLLRASGLPASALFVERQRSRSCDASCVSEEAANLGFGFSPELLSFTFSSGMLPSGAHTHTHRHTLCHSHRHTLNH